MPLLPHDEVIKSVSALINAKLDALRRKAAINPGTKDLLDSITTNAGVTIKLDNGNSRSPDQQWRISNETCPGVVLEVGYTQREQSLELVADDWITESRECVRLVMTVKFSYDMTSRSFRDKRFKVYRSYIDQDDRLASEIILDQVLCI